ncbi:MAG: zf-HC2 domain-containing protein [Chloroflexota bacterium]
MMPDELDRQKEMTHAAARAALQADADGRLSASQRQDLEEHLDGCEACRAYQAELAGLQTRLSRELQARWPARQASAADIDAALGRIQSRARRQVMFKNGLRTLVGAGAVVLLVVLLSWSIHALLPQPAGPAGITPSVQLLPTTTQDSPAPSTPQEALTPSATPVLPAETQRWVGLFPNTDFTFAVALPNQPQEVQLFRQVLSEALTADNARQMAARLGVNGEPQETYGEAARHTIYEVSNGYDVARFINSPDNFVISRAASLVKPGGSAPLSEQEQIAAAKAYLKSLGLLELPYQAGINPRGEVEFTPLLEGRQVLYGIGDTAGAMGLAKVALDPSGQVSAVYYSKQTFEVLGSLPILSAAQAWERLSSGNAAARSMFAVLAAPGETPYQQWSPTYSTGQRADLYGYLQVISPPGGSRQLWMYGYAIANEAALAAAPNNEFLHVWGQFETDTAGRSVLNVTGWEISTAQEEYLPGTIQRQVEQITLLTEDGRSLRLPGAPADLTDGAAVFATGVVTPDNPSSLQWRLLETGSFSSYGVSRSCGGGGGGGGGGPENANFGGGSFQLEDVLLAVSTLTPQAGGTATPTPIPPTGALQTGQEISGIQGALTLYQHRYEDGHQALEGSLYVEPGNFSPEALSLLLEGPGLQGAEPLQSLPVKVWGQIVEVRDGTPIVTVTRIEAAYPDLSVQAWMGSVEAVTVEGQKALLLSAQDGNTYILKRSIDCGADCIVGRPGDTAIYEGYLLPGETFGGYPVLVELSAGMAAPNLDLKDYPLSSLEIGVWDEAGSGANYNSEYMQGQVTIDQIELAYAAVSLEGCVSSPETLENFGSWLVVQPVWVFSGHFEDGRLFVIQIQALPD